MTREEKAIIYFKDMRKRLCEDYLNICPKHSIAYKATLAEKDFYDTAIEALEQEPCEDAISRRAVINTLDAMDKALDTERTVEEYKSLLEECYKVLPSVRPKVKIGHWYDQWGKDGCSVCNEGIDDAQTFDGRPFKYCPMCGARMVEPQESEE